MMNLIYKYNFCIIVKLSASFQLTLNHYSVFCGMEDRAVECEDRINVEDLISDENHSERSFWKV